MGLATRTTRVRRLRWAARQTAVAAAVACWARGAVAWRGRGEAEARLRARLRSTAVIGYSSPWGRILRSIREDEDVAQHHGHDVMTHKASALAVSAAIAAFAGALFAWYLGSLQPSFMQPSRTTFLVWAAFVIGGAGNNRFYIFY